MATKSRHVSLKKNQVKFSGSCHAPVSHISGPFF